MSCLVQFNLFICYRPVGTSGKHGRRQRGAGKGPGPPWIFKHGTNIVNRGLKVLFFGHFLLFFGLFFRCPPLENFLPTPLVVGLFSSLNIFDSLNTWTSAAGGLWLPWIFMHVTDKIEEGLMVLFLALFFPLLPSLEIFSANALV